MSDRNYYVICDDNCKFESMTKEQIIAAIAEATGRTIRNVDNAFITKLKEQNKNHNIKLWVGTNAQYNAITPVNDVLYIITDIEPLEELISSVETLNEGLAATNEDVAVLQNIVGSAIDYIVDSGENSSNWKWRKWKSGRFEAEKTCEELQWECEQEGSLYKIEQTVLLTSLNLDEDANIQVYVTPRERSYSTHPTQHLWFANCQRNSNNILYLYFYATEELQYASFLSFNIKIVGTST